MTIIKEGSYLITESYICSICLSQFKVEDRVIDKGIEFIHASCEERVNNAQRKSDSWSAGNG
jgi:hypothetical protein